MIYDKIKRVASGKNISIYRIEKDLEISNGAISKWNSASPSVVLLKKVADYLQVDINVLLEEKNLTKN